ncbi:MAG TPA: translocation/assembly module TamB domain-containing protein, partial [Polyangia bacterium]
MTAIALVAAVCLTALALPLVLNGTRLASLVNRTLASLPGQITAGAVHWRPRLLPDLLFDRPTPVVIEGLRMRDPDGVEVLWVPRLEVKVRPRSAMNGQVVLEDLVLHQGTRWLFARRKGQLTGVGFLATFKAPDPDDEPPDPNFRFEIRNARLLGVDIQFDFPGAWGLLLRDVHAPASLLVQGPFVGWSTENLDARRGGYLDIVGERLPWDRAKVRKAETTRAFPNDIFLDVEAAETPGTGVNAGRRARLSGSGFLTGIYDYGVPPGQLGPPSGIKMHIDLAEAAPALAAVAAPHGLVDLEISGAGARVSADLSGPFAELAVKGALSGLDVSYAGRPARQVATKFSVSLAVPIEASVTDFGFEGGSGGRLDLEAQLKGSALSARLGLRRFGTAAYLPPGWRKSLSGHLQGGFGVAANLATSELSLDKVDVRLERADRRARRGGNGRVRIVGKARATPASASTEGLTIELPGATITARGRYGLAHQILGFGLRATASDLPRLLGMWEIPSLARRADVSLDVSGRLADPVAQGEVSVEGLLVAGLPPVDRVQMSVGLKDGLLSLTSLRADAFGGRVEGSGNARLYRGSLFRLEPRPAIVARFDAKGLDLNRLLPGKQAAGLFDVHIEAAGTPRSFEAVATIPNNTRLTVFGEMWTVAGLELAADELGLVIRRARLERAGGGVIALAGRLAWDGPLDLVVDVAEVPIEGLPGIAGAPVDLAGKLASHLEIRGTTARPLVAGEIRLDRVVARAVSLGSGRITLQPTSAGGVALSGELFDRISLAGEVEYGARGPIVEAQARVRNLLVEQFVPEMSRFGDARARLSGGVQLRYGGTNPLTVDLTVAELDVSADRDLGAPSGPRRAGRLQLRNAAPIRVIRTGDQVVVDRTRLVTDGGELRLWGELKNQVVNAEVVGSLDLELVQPFVGQEIERLGGEVNLALRVRGTPQHPLAEGAIDIVRPIAVRLPEVGPAILIPSGALKLDASALSLSNLIVQAEGAQLRLGGQVRLGPRQAPQSLDLVAAGQLSGALVEAIGQGAVSDASGQAQINARVRGTPAAPQIQAQIDLSGLAFSLRDLGREVAFQSGRVDLTGMELTLTNLRATIDGQGEFVMGAAPDAPGRVVLQGSWPSPRLALVRIPLRGQRIPLQISNALELDEVGLDADVTGNSERGLAVDGEITVSSGRYNQDFDVRELVITPSTDESEFEPFYAGKPWLANLALRLRVRTLGDTFLVQNNLVPELHLAFDLLVQGTLSQPRISGEVRPTDGRFHLFGVREDFDLVPNVNQITFVETKSLERGETPEINLEAEALVTDTASQEHLVRMRISGPVGRATIDLSTNTGLDRSQALLLLVSGSTGNSGGAGGSASTSASRLGGGGTDVIGQLFADILVPYIDDTLDPITRGKVNLRPTLRPDGVELRVDARLGRQFDLQLGILRRLENRREYDIASSLWLMDYLRLRGSASAATYSP